MTNDWVAFARGSPPTLHKVNTSAIFLISTRSVAFSCAEIWLIVLAATARTNMLVIVRRNMGHLPWKWTLKRFGFSPGQPCESCTSANPDATRESEMEAKLFLEKKGPGECRPGHRWVSSCGNLGVAEQIVDLVNYPFQFAAVFRNPAVRIRIIDAHCFHV